MIVAEQSGSQPEWSMRPPLAESSPGVRRVQVVPFLLVGLVYALLWTLQHPYGGMSDDAHLYALQAWAQLRPDVLASDIFLRHGSQDSYTLFTPVFAWLIERAGLATAAAALTFAGQLGFYVATWMSARALAGARLAWLAVGLVLVVPGEYGAGLVFEYAEGFLSARLPAEVLVLFGLAAWLHGGRWIAGAVLALAMLMHPLVSVPAVALIALTCVPTARLGQALAAGVVGIGLLVAIAIALPFGPVRVISDDWLAVVGLRSWFLFPTKWRFDDWEYSIVPLLSLLFVWWNARSERAGELAVRVALIGGGGLLLALLAGDLVPVEIVVQGQPWRWMWLAKLMSIVLLPLVASKAWKAGHAERCSTILIVLAWVAPPGAGAAIAAASLALFAVRSSINARYSRYATLLTAAIGATIVLSIVVGAALTLSIDSTAMRSSWGYERAIDLVSLTGIATLAVAICWSLALTRSRLPALVAIAAGGLAVLVLHAGETWRDWTSDPYGAALQADFAEWRELIPPGSEVLWLEHPTAAWLLLNRPSYLSQSQSAGVVFSRATALAVARRVRNLEPLADEGWLYGIQPKDEQGRERVRPLTAERLRQICTDPELHFVVSRADAGPPLSVSRSRSKNWSGYRLYACSRGSVT